MTSIHVSVKLLDSQATLPRSSHPGDAGLDLCTLIDVVLAPGEWQPVATGLAVAIPLGYAGFVLPRSGNAARYGVGVVNGPGLIDSGYRGEVKVLLINHGHEPVLFHAGERIAQLVVMAVPEVEVVEVDELDETARGTGGFGSTGR